MTTRLKECRGAMCVDDNEEAAAAIFLAEINRREAREAEIRYWEKKA